MKSSKAIQVGMCEVYRKEITLFFLFFFFVGFIIFVFLSRLGDYTSQITCSTISSHTQLS